MLLADGILFALAPPDLFYPARAEIAIPRADAAAILFHDFGEHYQGLDPESRRRVNHAVSLYRQGRVDYLIMVGGFRPQVNASGSRNMARYAIDQGIPADRIMTDGDSLDTLGNLASIERIVTAQRWRTLFLVSSPHHLQRLARLPVIIPAARAIPWPYDPSACSPPLTKFETWGSVHYNLVAYLLRLLLPDPYYPRFVTWVRTHTSL